MKPIITRRLVYTCGIILLAAFLSACGSNSTTPTTAVHASSAATPTVPTHTPTPIPASSKGFKQLTGANFTINYPSGWQTSHKSLPGGPSGDVKNPAMENIYGFVAQDNIT